MTKEVQRERGRLARNALRNHLTECFECLATDPAAMCAEGERLLAAASETLEEEMQAEKLKESILEHARSCTAGCRIDQGEVNQLCAQGESVYGAMVKEGQRQTPDRRADDEDIPF